MNKLCKSYISDAKKFFPTMGKDERNFLRGLNDELEEFCEENNIISKQELFEQYGQPYKIANDYYESVDTENVIKKIRISKYIKVFITVLIAVVLITFSIFITFSIQRQNQYSKEEIIVSNIINNNADIDDHDKEHNIDKSDNFIENDELIEEEIIE